MKEMFKISNRYDNQHIETISECSADFLNHTSDACTQTDKENAKISILDNHDE